MWIAESAGLASGGVEEISIASMIIKRKALVIKMD